VLASRIIATLNALRHRVSGVLGAGRAGLTGGPAGAAFRDTQDGHDLTKRGEFQMI